VTTSEGISPDQLEGFFDGWPSPPSSDTHLEILKRSYRVVLAVDDSTDEVVGFITAISDGILTAYIPLLEVRRSHRSMGVGSELLKRMMKRLDRFYMVDLVTDPDRESFYSRFGMRPGFAMVVRRYDHQSGAL
jgi:ribosomal protein S18 acetylase RimI-like enzyme